MEYFLLEIILLFTGTAAIGCCMGFLVDLFFVHASR